MAVGVTPDGQCTLSVSDDHSLRLWGPWGMARDSRLSAPTRRSNAVPSRRMENVLSPAMPSAVSTYWVSGNSRISHRPVEGHGRLGFLLDGHRRRYEIILAGLATLGINVLLVRGPENINYLMGCEEFSALPRNHRQIGE